MTDHDDQLALIARGWSEAAAGYEHYFVPRFAPWVSAAVDSLGALPAEGPILVPCCGTFPELPALTSHYPQREIVGIDLSAGMISLARTRAAGTPQVTALVGDASTLDPKWTVHCGAVVSVFGLQQLPEPHVAIANWARALRHGGTLSVVFWPFATERKGPFALMGKVLRKRRPAPDRSWEPLLAPALRAAGTLVARDELLPFPMIHPDAATFFDAFTQDGPLRALAISRGPSFIAEVRAEFLRKAPKGEWAHTPRARLIVAQAG